MISWPNCRSRMPPRASSRSAAIRPKMFRRAGSLSKPRSRSGELRWKKLSACDWTIWRQVHQPPQLHRRRRRRHRQDLVAGLGRGDQVADRADAADPRRDPGHLPERPPDAEPLEAAELGDVEPCVGDLPVIVELDRDLGVAFDPGHGVDDDALCHEPSPRSREIQTSQLLISRT